MAYSTCLKSAPVLRGSAHTMLRMMPTAQRSPPARKVRTCKEQIDFAETEAQSDPGQETAKTKESLTFLLTQHRYMSGKVKNSVQDCVASLQVSRPINLMGCGTAVMTTM